MTEQKLTELINRFGDFEGDKLVGFTYTAGEATAAEMRAMATMGELLGGDLI